MKLLTSNPFPPCYLEVAAGGGSPMALTRVVYGLEGRLWGKSAPSVGRGNVTLGAARDSIWAGEILSLPDFDLPAVERAHLTHPGAT